MTIETIAERVYRQISRLTFQRRPGAKASEAQMRYVAALIAEGMAAGKVRWDMTEQRPGLMSWQTNELISSLKKQLGKE